MGNSVTREKGIESLPVSFFSCLGQGVKRYNWTYLKRPSKVCIAQFLYSHIYLCIFPPLSLFSVFMHSRAVPYLPIDNIICSPFQFVAHPFPLL